MIINSGFLPYLLFLSRTSQPRSHYFYVRRQACLLDHAIALEAFWSLFSFPQYDPSVQATLLPFSFSSGTYLFSWYWAWSGNDRLQLYKIIDENHCLLETHLDLSIASASSSSTITVSHFLSSIFSCLCWIAFWMKACRSSGLIEFATNKWDCKTNQDSIAIFC